MHTFSGACDGGTPCLHCSSACVSTIADAVSGGSNATCTANCTDGSNFNLTCYDAPPEGKPPWECILRPKCDCDCDTPAPSGSSGDDDPTIWILLAIAVLLLSFTGCCWCLYRRYGETGFSKVVQPHRTCMYNVYVFVYVWRDGVQQGQRLLSADLPLESACCRVPTLLSVSTLTRANPPVGVHPWYCINYVHVQETMGEVYADTKEALHRPLLQVTAVPTWNLLLSPCVCARIYTCCTMPATPCTLHLVFHMAAHTVPLHVAVCPGAGVVRQVAGSRHRARASGGPSCV